MLAVLGNSIRDRLVGFPLTILVLMVSLVFYREPVILTRLSYSIFYPEPPGLEGYFTVQRAWFDLWGRDALDYTKPRLSWVLIAHILTGYAMTARMILVYGFKSRKELAHEAMWMYLHIALLSTAVCALAECSWQMACVYVAWGCVLHVFAYRREWKHYFMVLSGVQLLHLTAISLRALLLGLWWAKNNMLYAKQTEQS